jgi:hypothetical protein
LDNLQTRYDLEVAEGEIAANVARDVQPLEIVTHHSRDKTGERQALNRPGLRVCLPSILDRNQLPIDLESVTLDVDEFRNW